MSQAAELSRVKGRIKALTEKTVANGCTEAEAMAAADMVGRLLERYALSMDEIEIRTARCVQAEVPLGGRRRRPIDGCVPTIARFCDCKVWLARPPAPDPEQPDFDRMQSGSRYVFFGFETDTVLATYLFAVIDRAVITETAVFKQLNPRFRGVRLRQASASFQHGVVARVSERLDVMHRARDAAVRAQRSTGTALILAKNRVVEDAFRETDVRLMSMSATGRRVITTAFRAGWAAGDRVNLNRPVSGDALRRRSAGPAASPCVCLGKSRRGTMRPDQPALRSRPGDGRCDLVGHGFALPSGGRAAVAEGHRDGCPRKPAVDPACRPDAVVVRVARTGPCDDQPRGRTLRRTRAALHGGLSPVDRALPAA